MDMDQAKKKSYWIIDLVFTAWAWIKNKILEWGAMDGKK